MENTWKIWEPTPQEQTTISTLATELHISEASAKLLVKRGISSGQEARAYVRPSLADLHSPMLMRDMDKAVSRLQKTLNNNERIMVYGDYDVDGTTAVSLVYSILSHRTQNIEFYIPDRYTEGYGISFKGIDVAKEHGCTLIIALDCGIKAVDKVAYATAKGIDFIICDHHTPGEQLPQAEAVLNMKRKDCPYPYKELSGCGVGFKFMQALLQAEQAPMDELWDVLPLLAMSIASDIVPLTGENRILAYYGLKRMNQQPSVGISSLLRVAGIDNREITITDLVYRLGPRINASGRMHSGAFAVQLLLADNEAEAMQRAEEVNSYNTERRTFDQHTNEEALHILQQDPDNNLRSATVVYAPGWHRGVIGIAASRLIETYYRPTIVLTDGEGDIITGSARSVAGFDIYTAIDSCRDLLTNFGGHLFAAGLSMHKENYAAFKQRFEQYVAEHITPEQKHPVLEIEQQIQLSDISSQFFNIIRHLEPFGPNNPQPLFLTRNLINHRTTRRVGKMGEHLRLDVTDRTAAITGIAFQKGDMALPIQNGNAFDACYFLEPNTFNHITTIQMMVQDLRLCSTNETPKVPHAAGEALK
ncbi:MAG: single-stranded-DNA-specific exonuclease RecJ [Paludibacteraceae bacterium]|nr:single-stranded-DNA-specific exonuclease RecJ [Paludibacteraceae bacterium]